MACSRGQHFVEQLLLGQRLFLDLPAHVVEVDEDADLGLEDQRVDRFEDIIDRAHLITLDEMLGLLVHRGQEDNRDAGGLLALADQAGGLIAVESGHEDVEEDDREIFLEQAAQRVAPGGSGHHRCDRAQNFSQREQVPLVIVDNQDAGRMAGGLTHIDRQFAHAAAIEDAVAVAWPGSVARPIRDRSIHTRTSANSRSMSTGFEI